MISLENRHFPVFIDSRDQKVLVVGGGNIATRRIKTLENFDFDITVVSPEVTPYIRDLVDKGRAVWIEDTYSDDYIESQAIVLACTDDREANRKAGERAKAVSALVSVCDVKEECNFYFPAIAVNDELTVGITGSGESHRTISKAAAWLRNAVVNKLYNGEDDNEG